MAEVIQISRVAPVQESKNYALLREKGLQHLQQIAGEVWTDHNIHDPGISLLELVCYAITELAHKGQLDIKDLLASSYPDGSQRDFYPAHDILTMHPLTVTDFRKVLIDIDGIRNAWLDDEPRFRPKFYYKKEGLTNITTDGTDHHTYDIVQTTDKDAIAVQGLYDIHIEFDVDGELGDLNESVLDKTINVPSIPEFTYGVSFPFLDAEDLSHWREPLTITKVELMPINGDPDLFFLPTSDEDFYLFDLGIEHNAGPDDCVRLGVKITSLSDLTEAELAAALAEVKKDLTYTGGSPTLEDRNHLALLYNKKVVKIHQILRDVRCKLSGYRNLCEDFARFGVSHIQEIAVRANIEVAAGIDVETLLAEIYFEIDQFLSPAVKPRSLEQMQALRDGELTTEEIFEGPYLTNGFIDTQELKDIPGFEDRSKIYTSDLINIILSLRDRPDDERIAAEFSLEKNIISVSEFALSNFIDNQCITEHAVNCLQLVIKDTYLPRLSVQKSRITFFRNGKEVTYSIQNVIDIFTGLKAEAAEELDFAPSDLQLSLPEGQSLPIESYFSIQEDLPIFYGVGSAGLPETVPPERIAQAKQLQGYLFFFEQLLANQLAQLTHIREFFSINDRQDRTYFFQTLYQNPGVQLLLKDHVENKGDWDDYTDNPENAYYQHLLCDTESRETFLDRRSRMLDHQMARYSEEMLDYAVSRYGLELKVEFKGNIEAYRKALTQKRNQITQRLLTDKSCFLQAYVNLGQRRADAFNCFTCVDEDLSFIHITEAANGTDYQWELVDEAGEAVLVSASTFTSQEEAIAAARTALVTARQFENYHFGDGDFKVGVECGFSLYENDPPTGTLLANSIKQDFPSSLAAQAVVRQQIAWFHHFLWNTDNRSGLEMRLTKLLGMRSSKRRNLLSPLMAPPLLPNPVWNAGHLHAVGGNYQTTGVYPNDTPFETFEETPGNWRLVMRDDSGAVLLQDPVLITQISQPKLTLKYIQAKVNKWVTLGLDPTNYDGTELKEGTTAIAEDPNNSNINIENLVNFFYSRFRRHTYFEVEEKSGANPKKYEIELKDFPSLNSVGGGNENVLIHSKHYTTKPNPLDPDPTKPFQRFFNLLTDPSAYKIEATGGKFNLVLEDGTVEEGRKNGFDSLAEAEAARENILNLLYVRYQQTTFFDLAQVDGTWRLRLHDDQDPANTILFHSGYLSSDEETRALSQEIITYGLQRCHYHIDAGFNISLKGATETTTLATYKDAFGVPASFPEAENIVHQIINFLLIHYGRPALFDVGPAIVGGEEVDWRWRIKDPQGNPLATLVREENDHTAQGAHAEEIAQNDFLIQTDEPSTGNFLLELKDASDTHIIARQAGFSSQAAAEAAGDSLRNLMFAHYGREGFLAFNTTGDKVELYDNLVPASGQIITEFTTYTVPPLLGIPETYPLTDLGYLLKLGADLDAYVVEDPPGSWKIARTLGGSEVSFLKFPDATFTSEEDAQAALAAWEATHLFLREHFGQKAFFEFAPFDGQWRLILRDRQGRPVLYSVHTFTEETQLQEALNQLIQLGTSKGNYCIGEDNRVALGVFNADYDPKEKLCADKMAVIAYLSDVYLTDDAAKDGIDAAIEFLSEAYSGEGFHMIEHLLLRPMVEDPCDPDSELVQDDWERFLKIPGKNVTPIRDPYSFQVTFILPNGCVRNARSATGEESPHRPLAFQDADYQNFVERMIRKETPAHILPHIVWVPSEQFYGVGHAGEEVSLEKFERLYRQWLTIKEEVALRGTGIVQIVDDLDRERIRIQNELVDMLNKMYE